MAKTDTPQSYEQSRDELLAIVQQLESGTVPLSESMELWEKGEKLAAACAEWLAGARARVEAARQQEAEPE
ncbi:MAG: exodeoxyribonuclease VII small subunit [Propionicimonas sp.]|uniref:exodeoxyribonuclease VII small subunit n=1 Tax=Propionicimonas sp. TaxID=1955623 RepID=UPI002B2141B9|nr:exodeoxyribonuclease VII small subunit [Propionicimonas sp.]MEA4943550.1 exodeoxyribonuclease VII small subunit [Propionicimonas sp.]MEA5053393.1 exodeoxyribonuclease VII small subunit [Propionicimonas sp.]MEA5117120.1 exodeoxyribonuclease VII small subunit [Propionicimonas sp.]